MVHVDPSQAQPSVKQVEFNTIASSFGGLSTKVSCLHAHLRDSGAYPERVQTSLIDSSMPLSESVTGLARGLFQAHEAYGPSTCGLPTCVIFITQDEERNVFDQRHLEYALNDTHGVQTFRLPFSRIFTETNLNADRRLVYTPTHSRTKQYEVTLVYFRAGYAPSEYTTQEDWDARRHLERSAAIKCPSVLSQLAGTKKVQQVLAAPQSPHLARFLPDAKRAAMVQKTFAPIYPMDNTSPAGRQARALAIDPAVASRYVLKPQREGGGNNVYRAAIPDFMKTLPESHWPAWILMEMIEPPAQENYLLRDGELRRGGVICELGVFGACLWRREGSESCHVLENFNAGYLLRTKGDSSEEGGVSSCTSFHCCKAAHILT